MIRLSDPRNLGQVLADLRVMNRLTQRGLSALAGLRQPQLADWETGKSVPTLPLLADALGALGYELAIVPVEEL